MGGVNKSVQAVFGGAAGASGSMLLDYLQKNAEKMRKAPKPPPDLTDEVIKAAERNTALDMGMGRTRQSTFKTLLGGR